MSQDERDPNTLTLDDGPVDHDLVTILADSLRRHGWNEHSGPVVVHGDRVISGKHRVLAARRAGLNVPVHDMATQEAPR